MTTKTVKHIKRFGKGEGRKMVSTETIKALKQRIMELEEEKGELKAVIAEKDERILDLEACI